MRQFKHINNGVWETLSRTHYINEDLAWEAPTQNEQEEKFFNSPKSPRKGELELEKVDHNLEVQIDKTTPSRYAHLEVNSCYHATMVEQMISWINLDLKQFSLSNQFVVQRTHCKKQQLDSIATGSNNASVDKGLIHKFNNNLNDGSFSFRSYEFVTRYFYYNQISLRPNVINFSIILSFVEVVIRFWMFIEHKKLLMHSSLKCSFISSRISFLKVRICENN